MAQQTAPAPTARRDGEHDFMPLNGIDHVELYVGNAQQAAYYYVHAFGFREVAYAGLETGMRDRASHVLQQGRIRLVLTGALHSDSPIAAHQHQHGDGVKVIALSVPDVDHAYREATDARRRGRRGAARHLRRARHRPPRDDQDLRRDAAHVRRPRRLHGRVPARLRRRVERGEDTGMLLGIDHIVGNVELGHMDEWVKYYEDVFGMQRDDPLHRRGDLDRVLGADVQGRRPTAAAS